MNTGVIMKQPDSVVLKIPAHPHDSLLSPSDLWQEIQDHISHTGNLRNNKYA